jgi:hypothetical protein
MPRIRIDLDQLCVALSDHHAEWVLDTQTGNILMASWLTDPDLRELEEEASGEDFGDDPLEGDRFLFIEPLESNEGFRWMENFALGQNERVRERLLDALDRPHPFRRFKDALGAFPEVHEAWYAYEEGRLKECAREWLTSCHIDADLFEAAPPTAS